MDPVGFAFPFGAYEGRAEQVVKGCGFSSARITGGLDRNGTGAGPVYAETIPPADPYATRTVYNNAGSAPYTPSFLENSGTAAAQNGARWAPPAFPETSSHTSHPANPSYRSPHSAPTQPATLNRSPCWLSP